MAAAGNHPVRPRAAVARIDVTLARDARLVLAEAIVFGRTGMGEAVEQGSLFDRWRVRRDGKVDLCRERSARRRDCGVGSPIRPSPKGGIAVATVLIAPGDDALRGKKSVLVR